MVHIIDDMIVESEESFSVMLLSSGNVHVSPSNIATTVTILDDLSDGKYLASAIKSVDLVLSI